MILSNKFLGLIFVLGCLFTTCSYAQSLLESNGWVSSDLSIELSFDNNTVLLKTERYKARHGYTLRKDTLVIKEVNNVLRGDVYQEQVKYYLFLIKINCDSLVFQPINNWAKRITSKTKNTLYRLDKSSDEKLGFKKLIFNSSSCKGSCPDIMIEIDSMGTYFFIGKNTVENLNGRFEGKLSKEELTKLMDLLNSSRLEKVKNKPDNLFDTVDQSDKTLTIFFSNEKIDLLFNDVPLYLKRLVDYLYSSYKNVPLSKTSKKDIFDR